MNQDKFSIISVRVFQHWPKGIYVFCCVFYQQQGHTVIPCPVTPIYVGGKTYISFNLLSTEPRLYITFPMRRIPKPCHDHWSDLGYSTKPIYM